MTSAVGPPVMSMKMTLCILGFASDPAPDGACFTKTPREYTSSPPQPALKSSQSHREHSKVEINRAHRILWLHVNRPPPDGQSDDRSHEREADLRLLMHKVVHFLLKTRAPHVVNFRRNGHDATELFQDSR